MRTISFVERLEFECQGNIVSKALAVGDVDNDKVGWLQFWLCKHRPVSVNNKLKAGTGKTREGFLIQLSSVHWIPSNLLLSSKAKIRTSANQSW